MPEHGRMSTIRVQYGLRIKDLRDERGLSQRGFAALIGMSPTYLADIERGARNVSIDNNADWASCRRCFLDFPNHGFGHT